MDAAAMQDERGWLRTAKSCGPGAPVLALSFARSRLLRDDGGNKPVTGESSKETVKPSRRESRIASAGPVCSCALSFAQIAHETAGAARTRLSLRPLPSERVKRLQISGVSCRGNADVCHRRHRPRKRAIQYSREVSERTEQPSRTGCPACAGRDSVGCDDVIAITAQRLAVH